MKKSTLLVGMLMVILLFECFIVVGDSGAFGCGHESFYCFNRKTGEFVGKDFVRLCFNWRQLECLPCYCDGDPGYCTGGYGAKWCNQDFPQCNGECCKCYQKSGACARGACCAPNSEYCHVPCRK